MQLLSYTEFKEIADFTDGSDDRRFNKQVKVAQSSYLSNLIGGSFVSKIQDGSYSELLSFVKTVLAKEMERYFVETGNVWLTGRGAVERRSDNSDKIEGIDKEGRLKNIVNTLRHYESLLLQKINEGDYSEYSGNQKTSSFYNFTISSIG